MSKDPRPSTQKARFYKEAKTLLPEIEGQAGYEAWSLYHGLAFRFLKEGGFSESELEFMEENLCIFSALYGLLSPRDSIVRYRLDFSQKGLYVLWGDLIYKDLRKRLQEGEWIINLASDEFSKTIRRYLQKEDCFLDIEFLEEKNGKLKKHSTISKKGRGSMARYLIKSKNISLDTIKAFQEENYCFSKELSEERRFVFLKKTD